MTVELECGCCYRSVSFDNPEPGAPLFCPICKAPIPAVAVEAPSHGTLPAALAPDGLPWWVSGEPASSTEMVLSKSQLIPPPAPPIQPAATTPRRLDLSFVALAFGVLAFAVLWFRALLVPGIVLGTLGLLLAGLMLGQRLAERRGCSAFPLAVSIVNLQAIVLAASQVLAAQR